MNARNLALAFALGLVALPARAEPRQQIAVMDFEARNVEPVLAESVTESVVGGLRDLRVFKVISRGEIRQMLSIDRDRSALNGSCSDSSCLAELGTALGARYLVVGTVSGLDKQKGPFALKLQLFDMKKAEVVSEQARADFPSAREAVAQAPVLATLVVRPILDKEQGFLELSCRESGAKVSIDGRLVGLTPFPVQKLAWGPHRVVVEKEGFIAWAKDVQIERNQASTEVVTLIPSPDFIDAYRSRNQLFRVGAWTATGLAVAGVGAAAYFQLAKVDPTYEKFKPLQEAFLTNSRQSISTACANASEQLASDDPRRSTVGSDLEGACYNYAKELSDQGSTYLWSARGAGGIAAVAAGAAAYFWAAGEDPSRYDVYLGSEVTPSATTGVEAPDGPEASAETSTPSAPALKEAPAAAQPEAPAPAEQPEPAPAPAKPSPKPPAKKTGPRGSLFPIPGGAMASFEVRF